ncbi:MAG: glycoside hydrolase family 130 protein [Gammaproteobacteria bacterium]|nr:MAG: glycoside hydrolase family 130 protein [Gammaproteobacteria bacterium]
MYHPRVKIERVAEQLDPDPRRVIPRFFGPGDEQRLRGIIRRIRALDRATVAKLLLGLERSFRKKHPDLAAIARSNYDAVKYLISDEHAVDEQRRLLIGACFTMEYAIESAALFNPSMVPAITQDEADAGNTRFVMSLRATGEGHISSVVFRRGVIDRDNRIHIEPVSQYSRQLQVVENRQFSKASYVQKLLEMGVFGSLADAVLIRLGETFDFSELNLAIDAVRESCDSALSFREIADSMIALTRANYDLHMPDLDDPAEFVIFPNSDAESHGIEDLRLVQFRSDDGEICYYGVYTAYDGSNIMPQLLETTGFQTIRIRTLGGRYALNKGMALFPRKVNGRFLMLGRLDNENLFLLRSDDVLFWNEAELLMKPKFAWEIIQIGNCGSPIETDYGWLLLTHGVGPMRQYSIGAVLLDLDDPARVIGRLPEPLLVPIEEESVGYVPNVVYSCGSLIHNDKLVIPYAISDRSTTFALVSLHELLAELTGCPTA